MHYLDQTRAICLAEGLASSRRTSCNVNCTKYYRNGGKDYKNKISFLSLSLEYICLTSPSTFYVTLFLNCELLESIARSSARHAALPQLIFEHTTITLDITRNQPWDKVSSESPVVKCCTHSQLGNSFTQA